MRSIAPWIAALWLGGCAFYGEPCQKQMAECLERCDRGGDSLDERTGTHRTGPAVAAPGQNMTTACERRCGSCRPPAASPPKKASPPKEAAPTHTS